MPRVKALEELQVQCEVPKLWNTIEIRKYNDRAATMFEEAMLSKVAYTVQYVSLKRFLNFVTKLYQHNAYDSASNMKQRAWLKRAANAAMDKLEKVVMAIEAEEERKKEEFLFDMLEDEMHAPPGVKSVLDTLPAPEDMPAAGQRSIEAEVPVSKDVVVPPKTKKTLKEIYDKLRIPDIEGGAKPKEQDNKLLEEYDGELEGRRENTSEPESQAMAGVSTVDALVFSHVGDIFDLGLSSPPYCTILEVLDGDPPFIFYKDDYHVSLQPVFENKNLPPELHLSKSVVETNRCFFLHLGIGTGIHPFALMVAFRHFAATLLADTRHEDASLMQDILPSVLEYSGFVDANALLFLWPVEFANFRLCFISGDPRKPLISCFSTRDSSAASAQGTLSDVLIYCHKDHFTLLRPTNACKTADGTSMVPNLLSVAKSKGCIVQEHLVQTNPRHSVWELCAKLAGQM